MDKYKQCRHAKDLNGNAPNCDIQKVLINGVDPLNSKRCQYNRKALNQNDRPVIPEFGYRQEQNKQNCIGDSGCQHVQSENLRCKAVKLRSLLFLRALPNAVGADSQSCKQSEIRDDRIRIIYLADVLNLKDSGGIGKCNQRKNNRASDFDEIQNSIDPNRLIARVFILFLRAGFPACIEIFWHI